ncbi:Mu-like prophage major head subunit gpT [Novipirellula aureliae]|uniref:Mu-like prophage major head subunit gpT n=1 Tax=Novipirellula aureliae TaxID=2527966 RepID=A0A5C6DVK5_9BACT|nr:Mu-like prophage major head subunit gpT family protein [Novipirellula aureliae]TWU39116.1 Mu-like prophage major head subunit gpT [Novipirellula aureliae]
MSVETNYLHTVSDSRVLEAAICKAGRLPSIDNHYSAATLEESDRRFPRGCGLNQLILTAAAENGYRGNYEPRVSIEAHRHAFGFLSASGFSSVSLPKILSNVANKFLMAGWESADTTPLRIAAIRSVTDFKETTTVSLVGDVAFQRLAPDGSIVHGNLGETDYTNKADTYARMLTITRTDVVNDDLGALVNRSKQLGRGAALMLNRIFWTKFLNNSAFFKDANNNVSTEPLGTVGLAAAEAVFSAQTDPNGNPIGVQPSILLVPTLLRTTSLQLMNSEKIKGSTDEPDANVWKDRFTPESSPYMSDSSFTGHSASAYYLLADPEILPVAEIVALGGRVEPVIETAEAEFSVLGVSMRGYSDIGVAMAEYRGGVRSTGIEAE